MSPLGPLNGKQWDVWQGDCLALLKRLPDGCADAVVTDPPYGLSFMGKKWDASVPGVEVWEQVLRVLKPGGHLLCFFGTRTYHRGAVAIEDAGFEIRDQLAWMYGSGFPKSHNLSGEREGWGSALKPAWEPVVLARKPLEGTIAQNVEAHGTGALNIDGCRICIDEKLPKYTPSKSGLGKHGIYGQSSRKQGANSPTRYNDSGRWPANICHDGSEEVESAFARFGEIAGDSGTASRFFFCGKATKGDRDEGLEAFSIPKVGHNVGTNACARCGLKPKSNGSGKKCECGDLRETIQAATSRNSHPTVKPTGLMRWLCRLITPPGSLVLDPFCGSGSTGVACAREGMRFIGMELSEDYADIARRRIANAYAQGKLDLFGGDE